MSDFRRTHHDNWQEHKQKFTEDQLLVLTDLLVSPCYYAWAVFLNDIFVLSEIWPSTFRLCQWRHFALKISLRCGSAVNCDMQKTSVKRQCAFKTPYADTEAAWLIRNHTIPRPRPRPRRSALPLRLCWNYVKEPNRNQMSLRKLNKTYTLLELELKSVKRILKQKGNIYDV